MRKTLIFSLTLGLAGCGLMNKPVESRRTLTPEIKDVSYQARDGEDMRKRILILPFLDTQLQRTQNITELARKNVAEDLMATRNFIVVPNSDLPQDVKTFIRENKEYDLVAVSRLAASLGIAAVVEGRILETHARRLGDDIGLFRKVKAQVDVTAQIRVFGARAGREILNNVRKTTVESETTRVAENSYSDASLQDDPNLLRAGVRKAFRESVDGIVKAVEKISWEGRVALIDGDKVYINAGRLSGIQIGDILKITEDGQEVFDPENGTFIGTAPGRMKGTVEVVQYYGKDGAQGIIHSGSGFKENDLVELY